MDQQAFQGRSHMLNLAFGIAFVALSYLHWKLHHHILAHPTVDLLLRGLEKRILRPYVQSGLPYNMRSVLKAYVHFFFFQACVALLLSLHYRNFLILTVSIGFVALPWLMLNQHASNRVRSMIRELPSILDLVSITMQAGHDLFSALDYACGKHNPSELTKELRFMLRSIQLGLPRSQAFSLLHERIQSPEFRQLAAMIAQSEASGNSLSDVLASQSWSIRQHLFHLSEKNAQKAPYRMLVPLLGLIFPISFLLLIGPMALRLLRI